jgi:hypothetical protein
LPCSLLFPSSLLLVLHYVSPTPDRLLFGDQQGIIHFFIISENSLDLKFSHIVGGPENVLTCLCAISEKKFATGHPKKMITVWNIENEHVEVTSELQTDEVPFSLISLPNSQLCWRNASVNTRFYFWDYTRGLLETLEKTHRIPYLANRPGTKKLMVATIDGIIYFVDYEKFDDQQNIWDLTVLKKTLCSVHILTENLWSAIFREIVVFYDPKERLFLYIPSLCPLSFCICPIAL